MRRRKYLVLALLIASIWSTDIQVYAEIESYTAVLQEYRQAFLEDPDYYQNNMDAVLKNYPNVDPGILNFQILSGKTTYYAYYDIDGNGSNELLIGSGDETYISIADIYTDDGIVATEVMGFLQLTWRGSIDVYTDGTIYTRDGGQLHFDHCFYQISPNGYELDLVSSIEENSYLYGLDMPYYDGSRYYSDEEFYEMLFQKTEIEPDWQVISEGTGEWLWYDPYEKAVSIDDINGIWVGLDNSYWRKFDDSYLGSITTLPDGVSAYTCGKYHDLKISNNYSSSGIYYLPEDPEAGLLYLGEKYSVSCIKLDNGNLEIDGTEYRHVPEDVEYDVMGKWQSSDGEVWYFDEMGRFKNYKERISGTEGDYFIWDDGEIMINKTYGSTNLTLLYEMPDDNTMIIGNKYFYRQTNRYKAKSSTVNSILDALYGFWQDGQENIASGNSQALSLDEIMFSPNGTFAIYTSIANQDGSIAVRTPIYNGIATILDDYNIKCETYQGLLYNFQIHYDAGKIAYLVETFSGKIYYPELSIEELERYSQESIESVDEDIKYSEENSSAFSIALDPVDNQSENDSGRVLENGYQLRVDDFIGLYSAVKDVATSNGNPFAVSLFFKDDISNGTLGICTRLYYSTTGTTTIAYYDHFEIQDHTLIGYIGKIGSPESNLLDDGDGIDRITFLDDGAINVEFSNAWEPYIDVEDRNGVYYLAE